MNMLRTVMLMTLLTVVLVFAGGALGGQSGALIALIIAAVMNLGSYWFSDKVVIKPNLVAWDDEYPIAPFGVYTTTKLVEDLIICLKEFGCSNITIGEGSVKIKKDMGTMAA